VRSKWEKGKCGHAEGMGVHIANTNTHYKAVATLGTGHYEYWNGSPVNAV
jgi:hypothetical protein